MNSPSPIISSAMSMATAFSGASEPHRVTVTRSSLACLPCRSRHVKCDGKRPKCSRCSSISEQCSYARSRRGGLDRAALAKRRRQLAEAARDDVRGQETGTGGSERVTGRLGTLPLSASDVSSTTPNGQGANTREVEVVARELPVADPGLPMTGTAIEDDPLVRLYYSNFHRLHPFILPLVYLSRHYKDPTRRPGLQLLVDVLRLIGCLYGTREWSQPLEDAVKSHLQEEATESATGSPSSHLEWQGRPIIMVQCRLLYSIGLFWQARTADCVRELDVAVKLARELGMWRREFAEARGEGDAVLMECWRRTWWMLFIVDAYYAGTQGTMKFTVMDIDATVDLPCEEAEYESGDIPEPKTLQEFDNREFSFGETSFSSFAYLIGAVKCAALAIAFSSQAVSKEGSPRIIQAADSAIDGWLLLLPKGCKPVMAPDGEIDELMFQAHLLIHVSVIGLHRPLSELKFNAVEDVSSCAREPPAEGPATDLINVHTVRVMRAVEAQIELLALPAQPSNHTPFTTCMVSEGTLALLSACRFLLKDRDLAVARSQIRMTIGFLQSLGDLWARTARNVREIQIIARQVLGLDPKSKSVGSAAGIDHGNGKSDATSGLAGTRTSDSNGSSGGDTPSLSHSDGQDTLDHSDESLIPTLSDPDFDGLCGWYNMGDVDLGLSWWPENEQ